MTRDTHHYGIRGEIGSVDIIITDDETWAASAESQDPAWSVIRDDGEVRACRIVLPSSALVTGHTPYDWMAEVSRPATVKDSPADARCAAARRRRRK